MAYKLSDIDNPKHIKVISERSNYFRNLSIIKFKRYLKAEKEEIYGGVYEE